MQKVGRSIFEFINKKEVTSFRLGRNDNISIEHIWDDFIEVRITWLENGLVHQSFRAYEDYAVNLHDVISINL